MADEIVNEENLNTEEVEQPRTISVFCAKCQEDTNHTGEVDLNGELVFTCVNCGGFIKVPAKTPAAEIRVHFEAHKEANIGQVPIAESFTTLDELMSGDNTPTEPETPAVEPVEASQPE